VSRRSRFEKLEKQRPDRDPAPSSSSSVAGRFGAAAEGPRVLDLAEGQPFVRCAVCRGDSHATSRTCCHCEAMLDTPEQRAFNQAFWLRRQEEDTEQRAEVDRVRAARERADREVAEARKHVEWLDQEIALRRARRLTRHDGELVITFEPNLRPLGLAIGRFFRRAVLALRAWWPGRGR
jgi:hypothetical protein